MWLAMKVYVNSRIQSTPFRSITIVRYWRKKLLQNNDRIVANKLQKKKHLKIITSNIRLYLKQYIHVQSSWIYSGNGAETKINWVTVSLHLASTTSWFCPSKPVICFFNEHSSSLSFTGAGLSNGNQSIRGTQNTAIRNGRKMEILHLALCCKR